MIKKVKRHTWIKNDVDRGDLNLIYSKLDEIIDYLNQQTHNHDFKLVTDNATNKDKSLFLCSCGVMRIEEHQDNE